MQNPGVKVGSEGNVGLFVGLGVVGLGDIVGGRGPEGRIFTSAQLKNSSSWYQKRERIIRIEIDIG